MRRAGVARFFVISCGSGLALTALAGPSAAVSVTGLALSLVCLVWVVFRCHTRLGYWLLVPAVLACGLFGGYLLGSGRVSSLQGGTLQAHVGETDTFELVVTGAVKVNSGWQSGVAQVRGCSDTNGAVGEAVWLEVPPARSDSSSAVPASAPAAGVRLTQGLILSCKATVEAPAGKSVSGFDQKRQLQQQGIEVVLTVRSTGAVEVLGSRGGVAGAFDRLRDAARQHLELGPDARVNEVLQGVVMGDTVGIDSGWMEAFRRSGTAHMLSVSGLHVASLAAIMIGLARLLRAPRWAGFALAAGAAVLMVPFVGPSPPIIRSAVMIVVVLLGRWLGRGRDQWQILALAAVVILAMNPFAVFDVGFQLSFAAFVGMMALGSRLEKLFKRLPRAIAANMAVSLAAGAGTAPVALAHFGRTSLVSPLANLLVVPTLPAVTGLGMASVFAGLLWHGSSVAFDTLASLPMMWTILVSQLMALAPVLSSGDLGRALAAVAGGAALLPAALVLAGRRVRSPGGLPLPYFQRTSRWVARHRPRSRQRALAAGAALVGLGLLVGSAAYPVGVRSLEAVQTAVGGRSWPDCVEVRVLDVGQGNAVLVRTPQHHALLFDGGPRDCDLAAQLRSLGVKKLDVVVISHPHADHFAGLLQALEGGLQVATLVDHVQVESGGSRAPPGEGDGNEAQEYLRFRRLLSERGCRYALAGSDTTLNLDGFAVRCFVPTKPLVMLDCSDPWGTAGAAPTGDVMNGASLVTLLSVGKLDVLLPGDAEAEVLADYDLPAAEVLVVPHHGSRGAVSAGLIKKLGLRAALVSVGRDNSFGHPDASTVSLLAQNVAIVVRTDTAGWVSCRLTGEELAMTSERTPTR